MLTPFPNVGGETFERSFDFSNFPNLQEVDFGVGIHVSRREGGLPWIPVALSTLRPATSPHLSAIRFDFNFSVGGAQSVETLIEDVGNDLRRVADEVTRIEREFEGTVNFAAVLDSGFWEVLYTVPFRPTRREVGR